MCIRDRSQSIGKSFIKSYAAVCLEGAIIVLACIIFSLFAAAPPAVNPDAAAVSMVWSYIGEPVSYTHLDVYKRQAQKPDAVQLKDYSTWKRNRIYVNKDAHKIVILEPGKEYTQMCIRDRARPKEE